MTPLPYDRFRTGLTYYDVYHAIYGRKWKRRRGVLGYWRELKMKMYAEYLRDFAAGTPDWVPSADPVPD